MSTANTSHPIVTFIGGGNMASAIIGGLIRQGHPATALQVVEPWDEQRTRLAEQFPGMTVLEAASAALQGSSLVVWAVKPQTFKEAAAQAQPFLGDTLHLSVAAGITSDSISAWLGTSRTVRAMPNTPALVGLGMTGLFARPGVSDAERALVETVVKTTGDLVWVEAEAQLDAVTALSGSGPAYVFYFLEAMRDAGAQMGLPPEVAQRLAVGTFIGAATLAQRSSEPLQTLRERVTSKGGTTYAAITSMDAAGVKAKFEDALFAAQKRADELGREFGK
ncbi:MAG: pyrroline-5-carboxylate reductase [Hydrogenophaga sp.]|uniref:pyrroline-5-carboxylate reductase n=1 Tax=Hydrogenophaga sp. TaxID=1904254 RepID=UPI00271DDE1C|nr:pyrroline-5-carboxylate reductase [Hydrogenophaga sp.]MDO9482528.1 pyrroline-5-carboxylate reductase [Hydrogenophaga sp.]MDP2094117.1 pyrroline-5-carboxylate reductase [Hydrogenophaga sp.]MDP3344067.1 pyrroline-5-carboxylate reductase [Hydrogenophaga sp.]MDP3806015.1 pyrroline-5-carboxylate reductase [Hydrogenophaga sp.]